MSEPTASHSLKPSFAVTATLFNQPVRFLVDTGADISLLPKRYARYAFPFKIQLQAANGSEIKTYGSVLTSITIPNLHRNFSSSFIVADVTSPILGADFFQKHKILINVAKRSLIDTLTTLNVTLSQTKDTPPSIYHIHTECPHAILEVLRQNESVFDIKAKRPKPTIQFSIETTAVPKPSKPYRLSPEKSKAAKEEIEKEIKLGRMVRSSSHYASPFFPVKKSDDTWRFVADYTKLNNVTIKDNYTPPRIDDLLARIPKGCVYSKLDLQKAFFLIPIKPEDQHKTAVATPFGLYEYTVMPMGCKNSSSTLQRYIDTTLCDSTNTIAYCDDILLFTTPEQHAQALDNLLHLLFQAGLVVNRQKSQFYADEVKFLGHILNSTGYLPSEDKIAGLRNYRTPTTAKQVRRFLGLINFYRRFIPNASELQVPLTKLTRKNSTFEWSEACQKSFDELIHKAINATQLTYPAENDEYTLTTDASNVAVGGALSSQNGPIGFYSQQLRGAEQNYSTYDKELTAVFKAVKHFEWLLFGRKFTLCVDHKPLTFMFTSTPTVERRRRQVEYLSTYDIEIKYLPGKDNIVADALSRHECAEVTAINHTFGTLTPDEILKHQNMDDDLNSLSNECKTNASGIWRDNFGRILVPRQFRQAIIAAVHNCAHSGLYSTLRQIQLSYVWPKMRKDVTSFIQTCTACQSSKITRHTKPPFKNLGEHKKFSAIHIDFVGPLPAIKNKRYLVTIFDRGSRWFAAYPTTTATADSAVNALLQWTSNYGVPDILISDRGTHFEAAVFQQITQKLGIAKRRTTAYHPAANGAVERQHRRLKESLMAKSKNAPRDWLSNLPLVLLGLRNSISKDTGHSAAQAVYNQQLNIPGCVFENEYNPIKYEPPKREFIRKHTYIPQQLKTCEYVWLRKEGLHPSLTRPYSGPYKVLYRNFDYNTFIIKTPNSEETISLERLKPAWGVEDCNIHSQFSNTQSNSPKVTFNLS